MDKEAELIWEAYVEEGFFDDMDAAQEYHRQKVENNPPLKWKFQAFKDQVRIVIPTKGIKAPAEGSAAAYILRELTHLVDDLAEYNSRNAVQSDTVFDD